MSATHDEDTRSFEAILAELEELVDKMEAGEVPLAEAMASYEKGMALVKDGTKLLDEAQARIEKLSIADDGDVTTEPLSLE